MIGTDLAGQHARLVLRAEKAKVNPWSTSILLAKNGSKMIDRESSLNDLKLPQNVGVNRQTAHEFVRETLRQAILNGDLAGGTRLVQAELAERLEVSTTPVREALRDLASEGLIQFDPHRGGVVSEIKIEELEEIYNLRILLEVEAVRLATENMTSECLDRARAIHERMQSVPQSAEWVMLNREFHMTIYEASNSPRLVAILQGLIDSSMMYVGAAWRVLPDIREQGGADHEELLNQLAAGDAEGAASVIKRHMTIATSILRSDR